MMLKGDYSGLIEQFSLLEDLCDPRGVRHHHDPDGWEETDSSLTMTHNTGHGRAESRECRLMHDLTVLEQAREWKDLRAVVRLRIARTLVDTTKIEDR
jgi:hypothetical protein